jgi:hypothetical protein
VAATLKGGLLPGAGGVELLARAARLLLLSSGQLTAEGTVIGIHDSDLFWLAFIAAFVSGMACGWCLRDIRDAWGGLTC